MGKELSNQVLIQVKKEMFSNITAVMSDFAEWLERPDSSGISGLIEKLHEISASLNILGYAQASKLTDAIATSIEILKQKESLDLKSDSVDESTSSEVASALLVLENFIEQIDSSSNLDYGYLQRSYETLDEVNQSAIDLANLDMASSIDAKTYEIIAQNINEVLSESRQKIQQHQWTELNESVVIELINRNNELINLFAALNMVEPQLLLKKTNELLQNVSSIDTWIDIAEAMLLVESAFVAGQKTSRLSQEDGSDLFEKQRGFNRQLVIEKVLADIGGQATYYVEQFRKRIVHDAAVKHDQDWQDLSRNVAYYQSVVSLSGLKRLSDILEKLGIAFASISLHKEAFPITLFPPIIDALVGIEYLFDDVASAGNINEQDIQFLENAFNAINSALPISQSAKELYKAEALGAADVETPSTVVDSNLLSELDKGLDALEGKYIAPSAFSNNESSVEDEALNQEESLELPEPLISSEKQDDDVSSENPLSETSEDTLVSEPTEEPQAPEVKDEPLKANTDSQAISKADASSNLNESSLANEIAVSSSTHSESSTSSASENSVTASDSVEADIKAFADDAKEAVLASTSDVIPFGQYFNNKKLSDLDNIEIPVEKESFVKSHENAVEGDEFKEIFGEEFNEIISTLSEQVPLLISEPENLEYAKELRRSFHTLKGSGRMVGYEALGEFSWQHEQLFNNILDNHYSVNVLVINIVSEAYDLLNILGENASFEEKHGALLHQALVAEKAREALLEDKSTTNIDDFVNKLRFGIDASALTTSSDDSESEKLQSTQPATNSINVDENSLQAQDGLGTIIGSKEHEHIESLVSDSAQSALADDSRALTSSGATTSNSSIQQDEQHETDMFSLSENDFSSDGTESISGVQKTTLHSDNESTQVPNLNVDELSKVHATATNDSTADTEDLYNLASGANESAIPSDARNEGSSSENLFSLVEDKAIDNVEVATEKSEATTSVEAGADDLFSLADGDFVAESESIAVKQDAESNLTAENSDLDEGLFSLAEEVAPKSDIEQSVSANVNDEDANNLFTLVDDDFVGEAESSSAKDMKQAVSSSEKTEANDSLFSLTDDSVETISDSEDLISTSIHRSGDVSSISPESVETALEPNDQVLVNEPPVSSSKAPEFVDFINEQQTALSATIAADSANVASHEEAFSTAKQHVTNDLLVGSESSSVGHISSQSTGISPNSYRKILSSLKQTLKHEDDSASIDPSVVKALQYQLSGYGLPNDEKSLSELAMQVSEDLKKDGFTTDGLVSAIFEQPNAKHDLPTAGTANLDNHDVDISTISKRLLKGMSAVDHDEVTAQALSNLLLTQWQKQGLETEGQQKEAVLSALVQNMTADASVNSEFLSNIVAKFNQQLAQANTKYEEKVSIDTNSYQDNITDGNLTVAESVQSDTKANTLDNLETTVEVAKDSDVVLETSDETLETTVEVAKDSDVVLETSDKTLETTVAVAKDDDVVLETSDEILETAVLSTETSSSTTDSTAPQNDTNSIGTDAELSETATELVDSKKLDQVSSAAIVPQSAETNNEDDTSIKAKSTEDSLSATVSEQEIFEDPSKVKQLDGESFSVSEVVSNESATHIDDEEDSVNTNKIINVSSENIIANDISQQSQESSVDDKVTLVINNTTARKQQLDKELSQLAEHLTLKEVGAVATEEEKGEQAQAIYMRAVDKLESLSEMALKEPTEVGELIEAIYDIEDSLETDSTPEWLWRILDAIEQLLIAFKNNEIEISEELTTTLKESVEMIQDYENHDGENVDDLISKIMQERKNHGLVTQANESKHKFSVPPEESDFIGAEPVIDPNAGSSLTETFIDEALRLLATSQDDAEHWSEDLQQLSRLDGIRRNMHTLKGSALMANYAAIGNLAHTVESLIENVIEGRIPASSRAASLLIGAIWQGLLMLDNIQDGFMPKQDPYLLNNISAFLNEDLPYPDIEAKLVEEKREEQNLLKEELKTEQEPATSAASIDTQQPVVEESAEEVPEHVDGFDDSVDPVLVEIFNDEAQELIDNTYEQVNGDLKDKDNTDELKRSLHTLKGGARLVGIFSMGDMAHNMESIVENLEGYSDSKMRQAKTLLQMGTDALFEMLDTLSRRELPAAIPALNNALILFAETGQYKLPSKEEQQVTQLKPQDSEKTDKKEVLGASDNTVGKSTVSEASAQQSTASVQSNQAIESPTATNVVKQDSQPSVNSVTPASKVLEQEKSNFQATSEPVQKVKPEVKDKGKVEVSDTANKNNVSSSSAMPHFVRVDAKLLDDLIAMVGEMAILRSRLESLSNGTEYSISELSRVAVRIDEQTRRLDSETEAQMLFRHEKYGDDDEEFDPLELDRFSEMQQLSRQLAEAVDDFKSLNDSLQGDNALMRTITLQQSILQRNIQTSLTTTQMMRFDVHEPRLRRLVKQTTMSIDREAEFVLTGGEVELERRLLEDLLPALEHIMRNAISHGIEPPKERIAKGKPANGVIKLDVSFSAAELVVRVIDDGRGFDFDRIREKAAQKGILDESRQHDQQYLSSLIFKSGFSTAESLSQISGRGVGMDVVSEIVKQRRGRVSAQSIPGKGTEFVINMPFSMSISEVLLVEVAGQVYAAPMSSIAAISQVSIDKLQKVLNGETVYEKYNNLEYQLFVLGQYFSPEHYELMHDNSSLPVLFINSGSETVGFHIDRILNRVEIVVKNVNRQILNIPGISGATILGDGSVVPVLELLDLSRRIANITPVVDVEEEEEEIQRSILVVDDSVTMRKVATRLLERHEYNVMAAKDGLDAIEVLEDFMPDLILLDIEMPRMDGFEFAAHVRQTEAFKDVPIVMITSRTGDKHRERADKIGVQGYLGKPYREEVLIETIEKMLEEKGND